MLVQRLAAALAALIVLASLTPSAQVARQIPSPDQFFGFPIGAEGRLASWDRIVEYFQAVDRASPRVLVQELGKTSMGKPYIMAIVSSPDTLARLGRYQDMQRRLADPRRTSAAEAARIAREGKVVLLVGANVHANEIGTSQMVNSLIYKLASENSAWIDRVLQNVILLLIPSQNPDGQQMTVDWYRQNRGTIYEDSPTPELYHKYVGHDNNRDSYMLTQVETQMLNRVTYKDWLPEVYLDAHEMGAARARIFVPPFKNPPNPNIDPLLWSEVNMLGQAMAARLHEADKPGVIWGEQYSGFWEGANSTNPWWHNIVALLTETASARMATSIVQERAVGGQRTERSDGADSVFADRDAAVPLAAPQDVTPRMNYPQPWMGGVWRLSDAVEYELLSTLGLLESVANNRDMLKRNFHAMNARAIDRFARGGPYAYLVPPEQRDPVAAAKLLQLLQAEGAEVHRADAPFVADGVQRPAGTHVVLLAQPFGRWIKDMLEPQHYPDIRWPNANAPLDRPYDVAAWSLGMLMGVETTLVEAPFDASLTRLDSEAAAAPGRVSGRGDIYVFGHESNNAAIAVNRLLRDGASVAWARDELTVNQRAFAPGAVIVSHAAPAAIADIASQLKLNIEAVSQPPAPARRQLPVRPVRLAVFEPWGGAIDAGWTRWLLEQHEFPFTRVRAADFRSGDLAARFDVVLFAEMPTNLIVNGLTGRNIRPEYKGGLGESGVESLKAFVRGGGTVITLGNAAQFATDWLGAPLRNGVQQLDPEAFFCPGSILQISVDARHPIGYGMPDRADAMFLNNGAYRLVGSDAGMPAAVIARYPQGPLLRSGWIRGEERVRGAAASVEVTMGRGRIILHTFRVQNRGQTWGTFKLLFNSIFYGPAAAGTPLIETTQEHQPGTRNDASVR